ncbi:MAG: EAL domain-containing protein [Oceanococcus sp.]
MKLIEALNRRFGRLLVGYWITIGLFAVICVTTFYLLNRYIFVPMMARLPYSASLEVVVDAMLPWNMGFALFTVTAAALLIRFNLIEPLLRRRRALEADLAKAPPREQIHALAEQRAKLTDQLDVVLEDNIALRDDLDVNEQQVGVLSLRLQSLLKSSSEPLVLLDQQGEFIGLSQSMLSVLKIRQQDIMAMPVNQVLRFFDANKAAPREYPLTGLVSNALQRASAIPKLQDVIFLDQSDTEHRAMLSSEGVLDDQGVLQGVMLKLDYSLAGANVGNHESTASSAIDSAAFEKRLDELLNSAKALDVEHTLSFMTVDNGMEIYRQFGLEAAEELYWSIGQMLREEFGPAVELFKVNSFFFAVVSPSTETEQCQANFEALRLAVEARDFQWKKQEFRCSLSIVLMPIDRHTQSVALLIENGDKALRLSRDMGGNRVVANSTDEVDLETRAIDEQLVKWLKVLSRETRLHLQSTELVAGAESGLAPQIAVQIKVEMEDGFWADPGAFLASAERVNLLKDIDLWLLRETLAACGRNEAVALTHGGILLPLHIQSVVSDGFMQYVQDMILDSGIEPSRLVLALKEQDCVSHASQMDVMTQACQEIGASFALLGCRVSSMQGAVTALKPGVITLHPSLYGASDLSDSSIQAAIRYVVSFAEARELKVLVAEVVNESKADQLRSLGVAWVGAASAGLGPLY